MMKKLLGVFALAALLFAGVSVVPAKAQTVTQVLGAQLACDPNVDSCLFFPAAPAILCMGTGANLDCPQYFHPDWSQAAGTRFFGITNRTNPPRYLTSTTGITWTLTAVQPFTAAVLNFGAYMAVSSNGSLLAASGQGANLCLIRRSTDQGASWSTVFSSLVQTCSIGFGNPTPPGMYCAETGGYCAVINMFSPATITVIFSTDEGATWTIGTAYAHISADSQAWGPIVASDGTGILIRGVNSTSGQPFGSKQAADFTFTPSFVPSVNLNCRPFTMGNALRAFCRPNAGGVTTQIYRGGALGIPPALHATFTTADVPTSGGSQDFQPGGFNGTYGYAITSSFSPANRYNFYISGDGGSSFVLASQLTPTIAPIFGCCRGNLMRWGNKMYFTVAGTSSQAIFGAIQ